MRSNGRCRAFLLPVSKLPRHSILDGSGGVYVNANTLQTEEIFWFKYYTGEA